MATKPFGLPELGRRISAAREKAGLSQAELARRLGIDRQAVHRYEHGGREPGALTLRAIAQELDVATDWLLRA